MGHLHMPVEMTTPHKCCLAVTMLASQLWCPVSMAEMVLKVCLQSKLLATALVLTTEGLFFEVHKPKVSLKRLFASKLLSTVLLHTTEALLFKVHSPNVC